jgi:flagellar secretion chaperone FliS
MILSASTHGGMSNPSQQRSTNAYLKNRVLSASPAELRLMLLDGALKFAHQGRDGLATRNFEACFTGFTQCREIIIELMTGIRPDCDPQLATKVRDLYGFMYRHLIEGSHEKNIEKIDQVITLLEYERETWVLAMEKAANEQGNARAAA